MDAKFWHDRWARNEIGFHEGTPNASLVRHFDRLGLAPGARVFVPLCGKSHDLSWLASRDMKVVGAELSRAAVDQFFDEAGIAPTSEKAGRLSRVTAGPISIFAGDIFDLDAETLGTVDAVYDRAALIALPPDMRPRYAAHLAANTNAAPQLLVTLEFAEGDTAGPPFSVTAADVHRYYADRFHTRELERTTPNPARRDGRTATTVVWHLTGNSPK